jgi:predicted negative regulator of RcsB-dependent stress response
MKRPASVTLILFAMFAASCSATRGSEDWVTQAESANHVADEKIGQGDFDGARNVLRSATESAVPKATNADDARVVRQDLYYRLAELELSQNRTDEALRWATTGLELGHGTDVFTANLHIVRGKALEHRADASGASRDYHDALLITEALLDKSLGDKGSR